MALSGSSRVAATTQNDLVFSWAATQSVDKNQSTVTWRLQLTAGNYGRISASAGSPWAVTLDGQTFSGTTSIAIGNNETKILAAGTAILQHAETGEKSFDFSFSQEFYINFGGQSVGIVTGSGQGILDPISRASQPTASAQRVTLGEPVTLYTNRTGDFTHALEYSFGTVSGVVAQGVGEWVQWVPEPELARQIPDSVIGTATIRCHTYDGDTLLGTRELALSLAVPETMVPSVEAAFTDLSGAQTLLGSPVQNVSKFAVQVTGTGVWGSTIATAAVTLDGQPYRSGVITQAGEVSFTVSVTDSRGRVGSRVYPMEISAYQMPRLTLDASRCREDGTHDDTGEFAHITLRGAVMPIGSRNYGDITLRWGWETEEIPVEAGEFTLERIVPADSNTTVEISAMLADLLASVQDAMTLSTGYATMDLLSGGRGVAFGKSATREGFDCAMPAWFAGGINGGAFCPLGGAVTGPVLAAVLGNDTWGLYLVTVENAAVTRQQRLAGDAQAVFRMDEGLVVENGGYVGWLLGLFPG